MADFKNRDSVEDVLQEDRKERRRRPSRLPQRTLHIIIGLVAVAVVVVVIVVAVTAARGTSEVADYQRYISSVTDILKQSDTVGKQLSQLLTEPGDISRKDVQTRLDGFISKSTQLEKEAKALEPPEELVTNDISQFFVLVMSFRREGLEMLEPALMNGLDSEETDVASEQISQALYYLTSSDFLYSTVFLTGARDIVKEKNLPGVTVPSSTFIEDPDLASRSQAQEIIAQLKSTGSLQAVHGVAVAKVVAQPDDQQIKNGQTYNLTSTDELTFLVTVENQGNMTEKEVPVTVTLGVDGDGEPQQVTVTIPSLNGGDTKTAEVTGINPTAYGEQAKLTVEAGPVPEEKYMDNNSIDATVIFKL